jgi:hypothetical protein
MNAAQKQLRQYQIAGIQHAIEWLKDEGMIRPGLTEVEIYSLSVTYVDHLNSIIDKDLVAKELMKMSLGMNQEEN